VQYLLGPFLNRYCTTLEIFEFARRCRENTLAVRGSIEMEWKGLKEANENTQILYIYNCSGIWRLARSESFDLPHVRASYKTEVS
jgi:hypothetical protein